MANASTSTALCLTQLTENDVPGASLAGRRPAELKNTELKFWLKCRGDPAKGLKTKAELVKRVEEYIQQGKDKAVVDPDPDKLYTRRKENRTRIFASNDQGVNSGTSGSATKTKSVKYPTDGWSVSLEKMPMFTRAEMNEHVKQSGKSIGNKDHHSVPISLRKAKTFLEDEYLHEIEAACDQRYFYFKAKCCHSFRKNDPPHVLKLALCVIAGEVMDGTCSCVAGQVGYCNHILALMLKCCKFTLFESKTTKDLYQEQDENPALACTSLLQKWHQRGGGQNIVAQPVMDVQVQKTKLDESKPGGVKCLLYEARKQPKIEVKELEKLKAVLNEIDPSMGLAQVDTHEHSSPQLIDTKFGESPIGSFLSYQVSYTESNFTAIADLSAVQRNNTTSDPSAISTYPRFPLRDEDDIIYPRTLSESEGKLFSDLNADENKINFIESNTQDQADSEKWKCERTYRFTASQFNMITKRQRNHTTFAASLMHPKPFTSKYVAHGIKYEPVALLEYQRFMLNRKTPVTVLKSGLVVCKSNPILGATPDAKVVDLGCADHFGLAEVKCPQTKFNVTPTDACSDPNFCLERIGGTHCKLKRNHQYFAQVQGQMGITGARWCDFIVYTSKGLYIERVAYDSHYWRDLERKLVTYYFEHFIQFAVTYFQSKSI